MKHLNQTTSKKNPNRDNNVAGFSLESIVKEYRPSQTLAKQMIQDFKHQNGKAPTPNRDLMRTEGGNRLNKVAKNQTRNN